MLAPEIQRGFLLPFAIVLMVAAAGLAVVISYMVTSGTHSSVSHISATQALYIAESALARGTRAQLSEDLSGGSDSRIACSAVAGDASLTNINLAGGVYTVTADNAGVSYYNGGTTAAPAVTTLSANITAAATVIRINAASTYPSAGRVMIDREVIDYSGIETTDATVCGGTAPCLLGTRRARDGSRAAAHSNGTAIGQYQCALRAQAGVPDLTNPLGKRTLTEGVQLQEAWAVGKAGGGGLTEDFEDVDCISATNDCWAVGKNGTVAFWDGSLWSITSVTGSNGQDLKAVHCSASNNCWAVGKRDGNDFTLVRWDGSNWIADPLTDGANREDLEAVYCKAANECYAVGKNETILVYNGAAWSVQNPGLVGEDLNGVFCSPDNNCWAVGKRAGNNFTILRKNGAVAWSDASLNAGANREDLNDVFCTADNQCWAVGKARGANFTVARWDTANWTVASFNGFGNQEDLESVSCDTNSNCWAVGKQLGNNFTFARWNGSNWSAAPVTDATNREDLKGISCTNTAGRRCWAVGKAGRFLSWDGSSWSLFGISGNASLLRWSASSWADRSAMVPAGAEDIIAVSMLSYADGWAVGKKTATDTTIMRWNGSAWNLETAGINENLEAVDAVSSSEVWAVGKRGECTANRVTILRRTGAGWACSPGLPAVDTDLKAIAMLDTDGDGDADDGWATGKEDGCAAVRANDLTLLRWTGSAWRCAIITELPGAAINEELKGLQLILSADGSAREGWAVGKRDGPRWTILRWDGTSWSLSIPATAGEDLEDISMLDTNGDGNANDGWAVGKDVGGQPAMLRWNNNCDGSTINTGNWTDCTGSAPNINGEDLQGVMLVTPKDGWAVGKKGFLLHWDGTSWTTQASPTTADLDKIFLISHRQQPRSAWREAFP